MIMAALSTIVRPVRHTTLKAWAAIAEYALAVARDTQTNGLIA